MRKARFSSISSMCSTILRMLSTVWRKHSTQLKKKRKRFRKSFRTSWNFFDVLAEDDDEDYDEDDDDLYEVICPECGETYLTDFESFEEDDVSCPACGAPFKLEESV